MSGGAARTVARSWTTIPLNATGSAATFGDHWMAESQHPAEATRYESEIGLPSLTRSEGTGDAVAKGGLGAAFDWRTL